MKRKYERRKIKMRKNMRYFYLTVSLLVFVFSFCKVISLFSENKIENKSIEIYSYTNKFNYDYNVNLITNKYVDDDSIKGKSVFVTDLIKDIEIKLNYEYKGIQSSDVTYNYAVTGILSGVYTKDGEEQKILEKKYKIKEQNDKIMPDGQVIINEKIILDLKEQNDLIKEFEQKMNMTVAASYTILLNVTTRTEIQGEVVNNTYQTQVQIGLADKTTKILGDNNKEESKYVNSIESENINESPIQLIIFTTLGIIAVLIFKYVLDKTENTNIIKNEYRQVLNRILKVCKEKIVEVKSKPDISENNLIEVSDFGEIIKLSEELFKPILYWENKEKEESWFVVMSNNLIYRYILKK